MKEILAAIDFSKSSVQALHYALNLSQVCGSNLKMVYVRKLRDKSSSLIRDEKGMATSIRESFQKLVEENDALIPGRLSYKILYGKIWEEISNQAKYTDAEMIVTGAHGMSGYEELWVGNNAMKIVAHSEKPVLVVKKGFKLKTNIIEKIVIPIDHSMETMQKIPFTITLAMKFKAQLNILSVVNPKVKQSADLVDMNTASAMELVASTGLRYINEKKTSENPAQTIIEYSAQRNADLISIMTENESWNSIFVGVNPQQIINQSQVPVLNFRASVKMSGIKQPELVASK